MRMTKDMYESLQVKDLKEIAASRGLSLPARVKKEDIVGKLLELDRAEDEKVLKEREAARAQREGAGEREHSAPARRGRKPGARKEEGKEGRKEKEGPASEKRRAGRPRKKEASAEAAQTESPVQMQTAASSYQESTQEMAPAQIQETAASMENPSAEQQLAGQQPAESAAATAGNPGTVRANANSEAVRSFVRKFRGSSCKRKFRSGTSVWEFGRSACSREPGV